MNPCDNLIPFADGELDPPSADEFRAHLRGCAPCRQYLVDAIELSSQLSTLNPRKEIK